MTSVEITFRFAESADADRLMKLTGLSPGAPIWTAQTWQRVVASAGPNRDRIVLIVESGDQFVGFGVISKGGESAEIESLAVSAAWRRRGVGRRLCEELLRWAGARGAAEVFLEVRVSNLAARSLYSSVGFQEAGVRRAYYREPDEDAFVMTRAL